LGPGQPLPGRLSGRSHHAEHRAAASAAWPGPAWPGAGLAKSGYIVATIAVVAVVAVSLGAYSIYRKDLGNITVVKVSGLSHRSV